ncbi:MAG TPA: beta-ketoacyl synthase N-terminal-like domain-containing protein [Verrucomicrobiae bacterium]|jgi:3-oxoacyl-[acyl-carrier-protein] synthase-1|nr:beta-ketoacyl synthase N-terminal-like domain-containing protein [Verrucomicrobiae bacterium]
MSEVVTWRGKLAITGIGLVTPVGLSAAASTAALRAGISRIGDLPGFTVPNAAGEPQPATGAEVPVVPGNRQGPARLLRLAEQALREAVGDARLSQKQRCALLVGTPGPNPARRTLSYSAVLSQGLERVLAGLVGASRVQLFETGRASALQALRMAANVLTMENPPDAAIVGGVDSLINPLTMRFLQSSGRLREGRKSTGILPGEGAGFLVVETPERAARRGAAILATVEAAAGGVDLTPANKPNRAVVLGRVLRGIADKLTDPAMLIISDLNGERHRAYEWMFASTRAPFFHSGTPHWLPSESIGDAGAATGAIDSAWAVTALRRGYAGGSEALVWGASDEGPREAIVFKRAMGGS